MHLSVLVFIGAHDLLCGEVSVPKLRLFLCISHCSQSDSVSNHDFEALLLPREIYFHLVLSKPWIRREYDVGHKIH